MLLARTQHVFGLPKVWMNTILLSTVVTTTLVMTGCASKPQVNNTARYANAPEFYTVRSGDTLSGIATRYGLNYISVAEMNNIAAPYRIYVDQSIRLKRSGNQYSANAPTTRALNTADTQIRRQTVNLPNNQTAIAPVNVKPTVPVNRPANVPVTPVNNSGLGWVKPSQGPVIDQFNLANNVKGIRYGGNLGDPVFAAANGQVVYAADGLKEYGNLVLVKHVGGYITAYAHNSRMLVKSGENVTAGKKIAEMGATGTNRVMLEFQVRLDGKPINPANILPTN